MSELNKNHLGHVNLRGDPGSRLFVDAVAEVLGQALPVEPNTLTQSEHRVYWLGPDEWQIVTRPDETARLAGKLEQALAGQHAAINDISGGQVALHLKGNDVPLLLARGCTLDLQPSAFSLGSCAQSGLAKTNVLLGYIDAAPVYEIIVRRSFSEYLQHWLRHNTHTPDGSDSY